MKEHLCWKQYRLYWRKWSYFIDQFIW